MKRIFKINTFVLFLACFICLRINPMSVSAMETGYFAYTGDGSNSEGYEEKTEIDSPFQFRVEIIITKDESLKRSSDENTDFTVNLYNPDTNELWASVVGTANYTYSDGVSVTINEAKATVTTYWSTLGVLTLESYILNNGSDASYICDFYLINSNFAHKL